MSLYPKKLNGLKDLQREKQQLKIARKEITLQNIFLDELGEIKNAIPSNGVGGILKLALSVLGSELGLDLILNALPSLSKLSFVQKIKKGAGKAAGNILSGFAKWEAIELAVRGIGLLIRMQKRKKEETKA